MALYQEMGQQKAITAGAVGAGSVGASLMIFYPLLEGAIGPVWAGLAATLGTGLINWLATYYVPNTPK